MEFYGEGEGTEKKSALPPLKSTVLNNFDYWNAEHLSCPSALLAFFGAYGDKPLFAW